LLIGLLSPATHAGFPQFFQPGGAMARGISSDADHKSAVVVIGKDGSFQTLHSTISAQGLADALVCHSPLTMKKRKHWWYFR
jgi:hypothetical protein